MAALAAASLAQAQPSDPAAAAADAAPRPAYRSVFQDTPRGVEEQQDDWKKANAEVGRFPRGHADLLKWEEAHQDGQGPRAPASAAGKP